MKAFKAADFIKLTSSAEGVVKLQTDLKVKMQDCTVAHPVDALPPLRCRWGGRSDRTLHRIYSDVSSAYFNIKKE